MKYFVFPIMILLVSWQDKLAGQCNITISNNSPCATESVSFEVQNPDGSAQYTWDFDGDQVPDSEGSSVSHAFPQLFQDSTYQVTLFENGDSCTTEAVTVGAVADPAIGVPPGIVVLNEKELKACNGSPIFELRLINASQTFADNISYTVNWGDGSPAETFTNTTFSPSRTIAHTYTQLGYFTIFISVEHQNGCVYTDNYTFYNGGNPSVGLVNPGNTVGLCAPATLNFPITNTENNPPGTEYKIYVSGEVVEEFTQENVPGAFTYTFDENSCGARTTTGIYSDAFDVQIVASNPCNSSAATIEPIEISSPPEPDFEVGLPVALCAGESYSFSNNTQNIFEVISGNPSACIDVLSPSWTISGQMDDDWVVSSGSLFGSDVVDIEFLKPGVYTVEMTVVSFSCGPFSISKTITIFEPPEIIVTDTTLSIDDIGDGTFCAPIKAVLPEIVRGDSILYQWSIQPEEGWTFADSTGANSAQPHVVFDRGGNFSLSLEVENPCSRAVWNGNIDIPGPPAVELAPLPDFCQSATLDFDPSTVTYQENGSPITTTQWQFPGAAIETDTSAYPKSINYDSAGTYIVELMMENACGSEIVTDTFVVQSPTDLSMPEDQTVCATADRIRLKAEPTGGKWSGPGVSGKFFYPAEAFIGQNTVTYTFGVGACFTQGTFHMNVIEGPDVNAGPDIDKCQNEGQIELNGLPAGGLWHSPDTLPILDNRLDPRSIEEGAYSLVYTITDQQGCTARDTLAISIRAFPIVTVPDTSYCNTPGSISLPKATPAGGRWSGAGVVDPGGFFDPFAAGGPGVYNLTYEFTAANGCDAAEPVQVGVIDPTTVDAGPDVTLCSSDPLYALSDRATPPGGSWRSSGVDLTDGVFDPGGVGGGTYKFYYEVGKGNCRVIDSLSVTVIKLNDTEAGPDQSICLNAIALQLEGHKPQGGTWRGPGIVDTQRGTFDPEVAGIGTHTLEYLIEDGGTGCASIDRKMVTVHPLPTANFEAPALVCAGTAVQVNNLSDPLSTFTWEISDGRTFSELNPQFVFEQTGDFSIDLTGENELGCTVTTNRNIKVVDRPQARFTIPEKEACGTLSVIPVNESTGFMPSFQWDFGNGTTSTSEQPDQNTTYAAGSEHTKYFLTLEATNECGTDVHVDSVRVLAVPQVNFGFTVDTACSPAIVSFNNISEGSVDRYAWDFGNGSTASTLQPADQEYYADTSSVQYFITLAGSNQCGTDTLQKGLWIHPKKVTSFFNISKQVGCAPFTVSFEDFSTPGTRVYWDFGDGVNSDAFHTEHTFRQSGIYTVKQVVSNDCAMDSSAMSIEVLPAPEAHFEYSDNLCSAQPIEFSNLSSDLTFSRWDFGNGDTSELVHPVYTFDRPGTYPVRLTVTDLENGCATTIEEPVKVGQPPAPVLDFRGANGCLPNQVQFQNNSTGTYYYEWDFGDGNTSVAAAPEHTYTLDGNYDIKVRVGDAAGCYIDSTIVKVAVFPLPKAEFTIDNPIQCGLPKTVSMINESSGADGYRWDFGDGISSPLSNPSHEFTDAGIYPVHLLAENSFGCRDSMTLDFRLVEQPFADFALDTMEGCAPLSTALVNYAQGTSFFWNFGDGNTSTERSPRHIYPNPGRYDIQLVVGNEDICYDTLVLNSAVDVWPNPTAEFSWTEEIKDGEPTGRVFFSSNSIGAATFAWDFGDDNTSTEEHPTHRYRSNGMWQVRLETTSDKGCVADTTISVEPSFFGKLFVPNAFSPDQGVGDARLFLPKGHGLREYHLQIFSAYGELLWESFSLEEGQPGEGWDGTHNGLPLPQDVYVWKIHAIFEDGSYWKGNKQVSGKYQKMGSVTLLR